MQDKERVDDRISNLFVVVQTCSLTQVSCGCAGRNAEQAIPGMLLALVLCFDHRKGRDFDMELAFPKVNGSKYIWYAASGYAAGLIAALAAGVLTRSPQPALLYLVNVDSPFA